MATVSVYNRTPRGWPRKRAYCCQSCWQRRKRNVTMALCDGCKAVCEASAQPNTRGPGASNAACAAAVALGWKEAMEWERKPGRRNPEHYRKIFCPACQATRAAGGNTP